MGIRETGLTPPTPLFHRVRHDDVDRTVDELLGDRLITAVVTGSDTLAAAVYRAAAKRGIAIGTELSVTGVDGSVIGAYLQPSLTTVAIPTEQVARAVVERALVEVATPSIGPGVVVRATLTAGESTQIPRATW